MLCGQDHLLRILAPHTSLQQSFKWNGIQVGHLAKDKQDKSSVALFSALAQASFLGSRNRARLMQTQVLGSMPDAMIC